MWFFLAESFCVLLIGIRPTINCSTQCNKFPTQHAPNERKKPNKIRLVGWLVCYYIAKCVPYYGDCQWFWILWWWVLHATWYLALLRIYWVNASFPECTLSGHSLFSFRKLNFVFDKIRILKRDKQWIERNILFSIFFWFVEVIKRFAKFK